MYKGVVISADYASPVIVNGFSCRNCSDVARAQRNIDPANPSGGPFGVNDAHPKKPSTVRASGDAAPSRGASTAIGSGFNRLA